MIRLQNNVKTQAANYVFLGIFVAAAVLFLIGYQFSLPILDEEEGWLLGIILEPRGLTDVDDLDGYPPLYLAVIAVATSLVEVMRGGNPMMYTGEIVGLLRLFHVAVNLLTLVFIYLSTKHLSNQWLALLAAFIFAISPFIFDQIRLALPEAFLLMGIAGSLFFALECLDKKRAWLAIASTLMALLAITAKYNAFIALAFGLGASAWLAWKDKKFWWRIFIVQNVIIIASALILLFGYGGVAIFSSGRPTASVFLERGVEQFINFNILKNLLIASATTLNLSPLLALALLIPGSILYLIRASLQRRLMWLLSFLFALGSTWVISSYLVRGALVMTYVVIASPAWLILLVLAVGAILQQFPRNRYGYAGQIAFGVLLVALWLMPMLQGRLATMNRLSRTDTRVSLSQWSNLSLPGGTIVLDRQHWFIFDPLFGGYHGTQRPWTPRDEWLARPLEDWQNADLQYLQLSGEYPGDSSIIPFDNLYHLKSFPIPEQEWRWAGDSFHIYRLVSDNFVERNAVFENGIELAAYELSGTSFMAGETLAWLPYWRASQRPETDYQVFLHLVPMDSLVPVAQLDLSPALPTRPSTTWDDSYETVHGNFFQLAIPENLEAGTYRLIAGLYRLDNFARLQSSNGQDYIEIAEIEVRN